MEYHCDKIVEQEKKLKDMTKHSQNRAPNAFKHYMSTVAPQLNLLSVKIIVVKGCVSVQRKSVFTGVTFSESHLFTISTV